MRLKINLQQQNGITSNTDKALNSIEVCSVFLVFYGQLPFHLKFIAFEFESKSIFSIK